VEYRIKMSSGVIAGAIFILCMSVNLLDLGGDKSIVSCLDSVYGVCAGVANSKRLQ